MIRRFAAGNSAAADRNDLMPGLRQVTKDKAIFYFTVDEAKARLNVLAIFFGRQDHQRRMLMRLLGGR